MCADAVVGWLCHQLALDLTQRLGHCGGFAGESLLLLPERVSERAKPLDCGEGSRRCRGLGVLPRGKGGNRYMWM